MKNLSRREFMSHSAGIAAAARAAPVRAQNAAAETAASLRPLGKTGIETTVLGMGTGTRSWNKDSAQIRRGKENFVATLRRACERGLRYFDMADMYGSHPYVKRAMAEAKMPRETLTLLTKTTGADAASVTADIERFRRELDTDYIDIVLLHGMQERAWNETRRPCMDALAEAKAKGYIRAHGISCQSRGALESAAAEPWADVMLTRINPFGAKMDGPPEEIAPILAKGHAAGKGIIGMKILGEGMHANRMDESLRYVFGLPAIDAIAIGFLDAAEVDVTVARVNAGPRVGS